MAKSGVFNNPVVFMAAVFFIFLVNIKYQLFTFPFDFFHFIFIEIALIGFFKNEIFGQEPPNPRFPSSASNVNLRGSASYSQLQSLNNPASAQSQPGANANAETVYETTNVEQIQPNHPAIPSGKFPPGEYEEITKKLLQDFQELLKASDWKSKYQSPTVNIDSSPRSDNLFRFDFTLDNTPLTCFDFLSSASKRKEWDDIVDEITVVEQIDSSTSLIYVRSKPMFPTSPRDSVVISFKTVLADGRLLEITKSVDHPKYPPDPKGKIVRASTGVSGIIVSPVNGQIKKAHVIEISDLDPGGWIPASVRNSILTVMIPNNIKSLNEKLKKLKPLDIVMMVTTSKRAVASGSGSSSVHNPDSLAQMIDRLKELEERAKKNGRKSKEGPVEKLRDALDWASPLMLGTVYFFVLYGFFKKK
jgi:hypothetical protein